MGFENRKVSHMSLVNKNSMEKLLNIDVQPFIDEYTIGDKAEDNKRLHNAPSCALKKFNEFKKVNC